MLSGVGNVTLPAPVVIAGVALCLLAGGVVGAVVSPDAPDRSTATVVSYDRGTSMLCLEGESVQHEPGADENGHLCALWRHAGSFRRPATGDDFRFVTIRTSGSGNDARRQTVIYGDVVK
jgi:hypothetical protein